MVDYRLFSVDQPNFDEAFTMKPAGTSQTDSWLVAGALLLTMMLASWLASLKSLVLPNVSEAEADNVADRPNILLLVADDLGYNDSTLYNATGISTPNLEALAQSGTRFTRHYADATCTPSRVALLSGRYPERSGFRPVGIEIPAEFPTIAEQLSAAGYSTYLSGKWHAGEEREQGHPQHKGFPQWFGFLNQWELSGEVTDENKGGTKRPRYNAPYLRVNGGPLVKHDGHLTDILLEHTLGKIESLQSSGQPWFLYHAFFAPHHPIEPAQRYLSRFPDTEEGAYRALVTQMDDAIGQLLAAVEGTNTLVVFLSDNGGTNKQRDNNFPFHGKKSEALEGAYRTPLVMSWPGQIEPGGSVGELVMNVDVYPTLLTAAGLPPVEGIDGANLWPTLTAQAPMPSRARSWEVYSENVGALNYSYLSEGGQWRLSNRQGFIDELYDLANEPAGSTNVAENHGEFTAALRERASESHWAKSLLPVVEHSNTSSGITQYTGLDATRSPRLYGSTIGIEVGPVTGEVGGSTTVIAEQEGLWKLEYAADEGLRWQIGGKVLRDTSFDPGSCNAIVLSHYFEPVAHLAVRAPRSQVKLYSAGTLRDHEPDFNFQAMDFARIAEPTRLYQGARADFYNIAVSAFSDPYAPRLREQFIDIYTQLHRSGQLSIADVAYPTGRLCTGPDKRS